MSARPDLPSLYLDWLSHTIDEEGVAMPHAIARDHAGAVTVYALALPVAEAYPLLLTQLLTKQNAEMIFAFDRFTRPDQGTSLGDVMAGWHLTSDGGGPFIIEYQHDPRIVLPICRNNAFWNAALTRELRGAILQLVGAA